MELKLIKDETQRNLGFKKQLCGICGEEGEFQSYLAREMMMGTKDEFEYFVCPHCGCLQIVDVPDNLGHYYGNKYYSIDFRPDKEFTGPVKDMSAILDVGCGSGDFLYVLATEGYGNLYGCDPFIDGDIEYGDRVHIKKCEIGGLEGEERFDYIRMGDSLEHVTNPVEVLTHAKRLIKKDGLIEIDTPHFPNVAFDLFQTHWYQLDAPRHLFIYSDKTMEYMAETAGLKIESLVCDSTNWSIIKSFFYQHGILYTEITDEMIGQFFSKQDVSKIDDMCNEMNARMNGDHMQVILKK